MSVKPAVSSSVVVTNTESLGTASKSSSDAAASTVTLIDVI